MLEPEITKEEKIDGVLLVSSSLKHLIPTSSIILKFPITVQRYKSSKFGKGLRTFASSEYVYHINMFIVSGFSVGLCVYGSHWLPYSTLISYYCCAVEHALQSMCSYPSLETAQRYLQTINYSECEGETCVQLNRKTSVFVYLEDLDIFFSLFSFNFNSAFSQLNVQEQFQDEQIEWKVVSKCLGQSATSTSYAANLLNAFNWEYIQEAVIHLAFDMSCTDYLVFWDRPEIVKKMNKNPNYEYYPNALKSLGNFYYSFLDDSSSNLSLENCHSTVTMVKMYNSIDKYVHDNQEKPFKEACIAKFLWEFYSCYIMKRTQTTINKIRKIAQKHLSVAKLVGSVSKISVDNYARLELVVSFTNASSLTLALDMVRQFVWQRSLLEDSSFVIMKKSLLSSHRSTYLVPCSNLLTYHLTSLLNNLESTFETASVFQPSKIDRFSTLIKNGSLIRKCLISR